MQRILRTLMAVAAMVALWSGLNAIFDVGRLVGALEAKQIGVVNSSGGSSTVPVQLFVLCSGGPYVTPADTAEHTLASCTVPGGKMGVNGSLDIEQFWEFKDPSGISTAGQKSIHTKWGPQPVQLYGGNFAGNTFGAYLIKLVNMGTPAEQFTTGDNGAYGSGGNFGGYYHPLVDTTVDQVISFTCNKAVAAENCTLVHYEVKLTVR